MQIQLEQKEIDKLARQWVSDNVNGDYDVLAEIVENGILLVLNISEKAETFKDIAEQTFGEFDAADGVLRQDYSEIVAKADTKAS